MDTYAEYNMYRGLQRPLVLFGLKGVNIVWGAGTFIGALIGMAIGLSFFGFLTGLLIAAAIGGYGYHRIRRNIQRGLHSKKEYKGVWIVKNLIKTTYSGNIK